MMGLRTVLLAAFYAAAAVNADNACNPIEACEGKSVGDDCSFLALGCDGGGLGRPIATGDCRPTEEEPNYPDNSGKVWCRGE